VSQIQYDRIMEYIQSGKDDGATVHLGGDRFGTEGYFINPTIFTDVKPEMKIVREEIFGPVGVVIKFEDEEGQSSVLLVKAV
jgi:aldehyde dehydrogenase (NAD+)